jgi:hypothetical protein
VTLEIPETRECWNDFFESAKGNQNLRIIGWRDVPVDVAFRTNCSRKEPM